MFIITTSPFSFLQRKGNECIQPIGMESGKIRDEQLIASSSFDPLSTGPIHSRLNTESGSGAWCPSSQINSTSHEWIQVELTNENFIVGVRTQGRWDKGRGLEFSSAYMIEYWRPSLGRWARYKDSNGNEIILANSNTQTAVLRLLDGGIIAKLVRLIPVSETIRTVCLRFELYGCLYKEPLISYSAPSGAKVDSLDLRDISYDGWSITSSIESSEDLNQFSDFNLLRGGLGKLFDGKKGNDNFEELPNNWIGWHKSQKLGQYIPLEFIFNKRQNLSAILLYTCNLRKKGARIFSSVRLHFSPLGGEFSSRIIEKNIPEDIYYENSRWVRIPIPNRIASRIRLELFFDSNSDWLLLSEARFEIENKFYSNLLNKESSLLFYEDNNYDDNDIDISEENNINLIPLIENCYLLIIIIICILFLLLITLFICLRSIIFSTRRRNKQKQLINTSSSINCYNTNNRLSSSTINNIIILII
ncbi:hypothetical protein Mgra_00005628 [Meloidogyne graminicola]|uniref:F5/8 type C domain-containing protein n=1 Tax=Meloidogyne graminicola TaxID=189291 RepID=A0A8S9ZNN5_9BILA|nr:hypothetical protein Mgra_00005628 [Meloidogyne graminicola]